MQEYIVDFGDSLVNHENKYIHERVVRCRDCEKFEDKWAFCNLFCEDVEPEGFCAWAERKEK